MKKIRAVLRGADKSDLADVGNSEPLVDVEVVIGYKLSKK